jgi:glycosyltransferase involved in cell wall biosynthesis
LIVVTLEEVGLIHRHDDVASKKSRQNGLNVETASSYSSYTTMERNEARCYRIDFMLTVLAGNLTRYKTTRPIVECDQTVSARWYPIRTWVKDDPVQFLPGPLRVRARHLLDGWRLFVRPPGDAIIIHAFELYYLYVFLHWLLRRRTVIVHTSDGGLVGFPKPGMPDTKNALSKWIRHLGARTTDLFVPWSTWAAAAMKAQSPDVSGDRVLVLHPGIDLSLWPLRPSKTPGARFRLLFVGGDLMRKGVDTLLDAFDQFLGDNCDLDIATQSGYLTHELRTRIEGTPHVVLHMNLPSGSERLQQLYRDADAFVLPTSADTSSWVALEALAMGVPVIICPQGGIPDIVHDGETGLLIPPKEPAALAEAVNLLRTSPELRARLVVQGRTHVEEHFDAHRNTEQLLSVIKSMIDARRNDSAAPRPARAQLLK